MNRYTPMERLCSGYFGSDHRVRERSGRPSVAAAGGKKSKERLVKLVPCGSRQFALRALSVYKEIAVFLLKHENVVKVREAFLHRQRGTVYLCSVVKAYVGQTLNDFLLRRHAGLKDDGYMTLFLQITTGLAYLHSNSIAHNALTAYSVVVTEATPGGVGVAKLTDYGFHQLCLLATDADYDLEEGRSRSLTYGLPPEAHGPEWGRAFDRPQKAADIFMLAMLFNAAVAHSLLPEPQADKPSQPPSNEENKVRVLATYLPFPGYGAVPIGKFLHSNPSVDLDRQLFRSVSPDLRRLLRRMALLEPSDRPAPTGVMQMLETCEMLRQPPADASGEEAPSASASASASFKVPLAPLLASRGSNRKRRCSSLSYDDPGSTADAAKKKNTMTGPAREWEKAASGAASSLVRRASVRLSQRAKSMSDYLNQRKSAKITD